MSKKKIFFLFLKISIGGFLTLVLGLLGLFIYYARDLPRPEKFTERELAQSTKIYDRTGKVLLYDIHGEEKRKYVSLEAIPDYLKYAVIAAEDDKFYQHRGLDFEGIIRAFLINLKRGKLAQGGSTITQQLIRSSFLSREKTIERKIKEMILTLELERRYSKDQILEWYLNQIPLGSNSYGVEAASQTYFNKPVSEVSLPEAAVLASLIRAPSTLSPYGSNRDQLLNRKNYVLERMSNLGYISEDELKKALGEEVQFVEVRFPIKAPHFVFFIKDYLENKYGEEFLRQKGLKVYTTLNWNLQETAEIIVEEGAKKNEIYNAHNASLVAIDPKTGEILAMVGSKDYWGNSEPEDCAYTTDQKCLFDPMFNVATLGKRQPGSAFKPFVYAAAFQKGFLPETILWDVQTEFNVNCAEDASETKDEYGLNCYHPKNYDGAFRGPISLREALAQSINLPSVKLLYLVGVESAIDLAQNLGISTLTHPAQYGLSLVLGGGEVKLLEMVSAYGVFATEGLYIPPVSILKIEDAQGNIIEKNNKNPKRVLDVRTARLVNDVLSDNKARSPMFGWNSYLYFKNYQVAAKTGTTQYFNDAWTIGYTPFISVGVWVGNNDNSPMAQKPSIQLAGPIWRAFMKEVLVTYPKENFTPPESVKTGKPILDGELSTEEPHTILHYIDRDDPLGPPPDNPEDDLLYSFWEKGLERWLENYPSLFSVF